MRTPPSQRLFPWWVLAAALALAGTFVRAAEPRETITLKVSSAVLPATGSTSTQELAKREIIRQFEAKYPHVRLTSTEGLRIPGQDNEITVMMQIAAEIAPDVLYVNFRNSDSYVQQGFLRPLDDFLAEISKPDLDSRVPPPVWQVIRRPGPDGVAHVWALPYDTMATALVYKRDLFREAGLDPGRGPRDWQEMEDYCRQIRAHHPDRYGLGFDRGVYESWKFMTLLWSAGGEAMREVSPHQWRAVYDTPEAVEAFVFYYKLIREGLAYRGSDLGTLVRQGKVAMAFQELDDKALAQQDPIQFGVSPVPRGPGGHQGSEVNASMMGIFSGVKDPRVVRAAWDFIRFYDGPEAREIRTRVYVEDGLAAQVNPKYLRRFGYTEYLKEVPQEWASAYEQALAAGKPEPYGKNANLIYKEMSSPMDQMFYDARVEACWKARDETGLRLRVGEIVKAAVARTNERLVGYVPPEEQRFRRRVAAVVAAMMVGTILFLLRYIWRVFTPQVAGVRADSGRRARRHGVAYAILFPALLSVLVWQYIPLIRGSLMAFQDYRILGGARWVGLDNFAQVLFDGSFWYALWVTCQFTFWSISLGFLAPVFLALLLQEVPRGKIFFRTVFFLPAILSSLVVIFLWRSFYATDGLFNTLLGLVGIHVTKNWLAEPGTALVACILPGIWGGMGPGCLIYLAALKGIPDELYEAGDLDGAGFVAKVRHIVFPGLKALLVINFVGAVAGAFHSSANILVMTGGGPYTPYGATEVTSLLIYYNAFLYLRFGIATTMAWTLGAMLVGFTILQLKRLSRMEFKTAENP